MSDTSKPPVERWEKWTAGGIFFMWLVLAVGNEESAQTNTLLMDMMLVGPAIWWITMIVRNRRAKRSQGPSTDS